MNKTVAIIGAGPGGLATGVLLKKAGVDDFVILEKNAGVGGTWYRNRYPGSPATSPRRCTSSRSS